ncbi:MAG: ABC transporter substrate-binding protein [Anaerolineales bacterium]|nr:ABC transporter substrate-binding protein [Anaerolineales bacterium]
MRKKIRLILNSLLCLAIIALVGCSPSQPTATPTPPSPEKITLAMGFIPNVQFAPFYVAENKGYFAEENLAISFDYGMETDLLKLVGAGELRFAVASGDQVILARAQGLPVVYVLNWYRRFPVCVVSLKEKGITEAKALVGQTVGIPATEGASYIGWRALLHAEGIDEAQVNLQVIGYTQVASLTEGRVDAAVCYALNEPVQLSQAGYAPDVTYVADYANLVSNGLITNEQTIAERPELVQRLVRAVLHGLSYTIEHPDEAFAICKEHVPEIAGDNEALQKAVLVESIKFWQGDKLGHSDRAAWEESQRFMRQIGLVDAEVDVETLFTNRFVVEPQ